MSGLNAPDYFVVGYGMDVAYAFRELPFVGVVKGERLKPGHDRGAGKPLQGYVARKV